MERSTIVRVREGLHARPATRFVALAKSYESDITLLKGEKSANAKSSVKLMLLGVKEEDHVAVRAEGADAAEAVEALVAYLENPLSGLDETTAAETVPAAQAVPDSTAAVPIDEGLSGVPASGGIALGPVFAHFPPELKPQERMLTGAEIGRERQRLDAAIARVRTELDASLSAGDMPAGDRGIIAALRDIAGDEELRASAMRGIEGGLDAVSSVIAASSEIAAAFRGLDDAYLAARAEDIDSVGRQICLSLLGEEQASLADIPQGAILVAEDIGAWDLARAPLGSIGGIACGHGGATSHIAIIARTHGIPAVLGLGEAVNGLRTARVIGLDGDQGLVIPDPGEGVRERLAASLAAANGEKEALKAYRNVEPRHADGTLIHVAANLGSLEEVPAALEAGAMGVGLFRTELLFMRHLHLPSEDMQAETYSALASAFAPWPVVVRTLDIGGDKPIAGIEFPEEENPFLGWRGIRMCLDRPEIFKTQLRALLRAAVHGNLRVMLPMVSTVDEVRRTKALIEECRMELQQAAIAHRDFLLGVMIETPAAVFTAPALACEVSFFSVGTNDLTQYVMAADRLNPSVAPLNNAANPAVMAAVAQAARAAHEAGIEIGMCGEAAARVDLIPAFLEMGLTELSMSPVSIPATKKRISEWLSQGNAQYI
jgi:phosphoenolpyruvate-protein phosphotransferase (PTS system enzyme I)